MNYTFKSSRPKPQRPAWLQEAIALQEIESNPLSSEQIAMFEMFERERWSRERRLAYIQKRAKALCESKSEEE